MHQLDYTGLSDTEIEGIEQAISTGRGDTLARGVVPEQQRLAFMVRNYKRLAELGILEPNWGIAYLHASHFNDVPLALLQEVFDACDKKIMQEHFPVPVIPYLGGERFSLFRGCAGPDHRMGMSWLTSLDKAIWYAAHHAGLRKLTNLAVYATTVDPVEIYCCFHHYDYDYIVRPKTWWRVDVPLSEFRVDRPR